MLTNMIFKHYIEYSRYLKKEAGALHEILDYSGEYDGYFQDHQMGLILCDLKVEKYLQVGNQNYDINRLKVIEYIVDGENRVVQFISTDDELIKKYEYEVFWLDEADLLQIGFELPPDEERDLMKYISSKIGHS